MFPFCHPRSWEGRCSLSASKQFECHVPCRPEMLLSERPPQVSRRVRDLSLAAMDRSRPKACRDDNPDYSWLLQIASSSLDSQRALARDSLPTGRQARNDAPLLKNCYETPTGNSTRQSLVSPARLDNFISFRYSAQNIREDLHGRPRHRFNCVD